MELTVVVYNIQEGGGGRLESIASIIRSARADAVALIEATPESAAVLARELRMELAFGTRRTTIHGRTRSVQSSASSALSMNHAFSWAT